MSKCEFFQNKMVYLGHLVSDKGKAPMRQKIKAVTNLAPATNIKKAWHVIGLIEYYRKFFPVFSDMIRPLNEITRKNIPFKWMEQCQKSLDYIKHVITTNPIFIHPDLDKQYYLFAERSKHSWSGIPIQYTEQNLSGMPQKSTLKNRWMPSICLFTKWHFIKKKHM